MMESWLGESEAALARRDYLHDSGVVACLKYSLDHTLWQTVAGNEKMGRSVE